MSTRFDFTSAANMRNPQFDVEKEMRFSYNILKDPQIVIRRRQKCFAYYTYDGYGRAEFDTATDNKELILSFLTTGDDVI